MSLNISSPESFFTWLSTLVSTAKRWKISSGMSLSSSFTVINKNTQVSNTYALPPPPPTYQFRCCTTIFLSHILPVLPAYMSSLQNNNSQAVKLIYSRATQNVYWYTNKQN